ncbi:MAG: N-acetyltransferase family protein [Pyrinomonadaceae bacterium]
MPDAEPERKVSIREASAEDALLISALAVVSFYEAYFEQDDPHDLARYLNESFAPDVISAEMAAGGSTFFIAFRGEQAVGYAILRDGEVHPSVSCGNAIELRRIYLVERVWGAGIGERLLRHCLEFARSIGKDVLWLGVWQENRRGLSFYQKHGFRAVGTLTFPYGDSVGINNVMEIDL